MLYSNIVHRLPFSFQYRQRYQEGYNINRLHVEVPGYYVSIPTTVSGGLQFLYHLL